MPRETDFTEYDEASINFLNSQNKGTKATYKSYFKVFLNHECVNGQQILESRKTDKSLEWEAKILKFKQWMKTQKSREGTYYSDNAVNTAINVIRAFFDYYHTPLIFNHNEARKLNGKALRTRKDYQLTNPILEKMAFVGNLREKYIILLGKSFGLRASDFIALTHGTFRTIDLSQEPPISIGQIQTIKEKIIANPFIDADALPIIKQILDSNSKKPDNERIITVHEDELSSILQKLAEKANINIGNDHLRFQCFRKYLSNRLSTCMAESKWKQIVGKAISEDAYVGDLELRGCYLKAMELTTIYKNNGNGKVTKLSEELTELKNKIDKQNAIIDALFQNSTKKDLELEEVKSVLQALRNVVISIADSDVYKEMTENIHEKLANKLTADAQFMEKHKKDLEKIKSGEFKPIKK